MEISIKSMSRCLLVGFFIFAGANHFINPAFYYPLIPDYLGFKMPINIISGLLEIGLGALLIPIKTRRMAAYGLIILLVLFISSHVYFIQIGGCISDGLCVPMWLAWLRLIIIHPLLIYWIYVNRT